MPKRGFPASSCPSCAHPYDNDVHAQLDGDCGHDVCSACFEKIARRCPRCHKENAFSKRVISIAAVDNHGKQARKPLVTYDQNVSHSPPESNPSVPQNSPESHVSLIGSQLQKNSVPNNSPQLEDDDDEDVCHECGDEKGTLGCTNCLKLAVDKIVKVVGSNLDLNAGLESRF